VCAILAQNARLSNISILSDSTISESSASRYTLTTYSKRLSITQNQLSLCAGTNASISVVLVPARDGEIFTDSYSVIEDDMASESSRQMASDPGGRAAALYTRGKARAHDHCQGHDGSKLLSRSIRAPANRPWLGHTCSLALSTRVNSQKSEQGSYGVESVSSSYVELSLDLAAVAPLMLMVAILTLALFL
jgi:hypothetical protein